MSMQISSYLLTSALFDDSYKWYPQKPIYFSYLDDQPCIIDQLLGWNGKLRTGQLTKIKVEVKYEDNTN